MTLRPAYLLGVLVLLAAGAGIALQGDPAPAANPASVAASVQVSQAPRSTKPSAPTADASTEWLDNEAALMDNALYKAGRMPKSGCRPPSDRLRSSAVVIAYARVMVGCLNRSWKQLLTRADFSFYPPDFAAYKDKTSSPCGPADDGAVAFYCPENHKIYLDWPEYVTKRRDEQPYAQTALMDVMAHEYGHHVQELVGIGAFADDRYERASGDAQLEESRRTELQASCFGAAFLGADKQSLQLVGERLEGLQDDMSTGDESGGARDHGSEENNQYWTSSAFDSASPASCNTWKASAEYVS
ncbi:neutral zinc metallopeptidase [Kribbella monticola]|uniref:neutral zinc metallopeptidase n=1 Tax=Kribbella monticola TaxID=2185285 RepID=UPI000DD3CEFC|nr:neutral zinc metallopeptidase [Kribbella monticola]